MFKMFVDTMFVIYFSIFDILCLITQDLPPMKKHNDGELQSESYGNGTQT